jgi:hypothetical protein
VIVSVGVGVRGVADDQSAPVAPTHTGNETPTNRTTPPPAKEHLSAREVVQHAGSAPYVVAVSPDDTDVRASGWQCDRRDCGQNAWALAVTDDAFANASYVRLDPYSEVEWAGDDLFVFRDLSGALGLVDPAGTVWRPRVSHVVSPLKPGETLVRGDRFGRFDAVDPVHRTVHPVALPPGGRVDVLEQRGSTLLAFVDATTTLVTSNDGGASWNPPTHFPKDWLYSSIDSGDPDVLGVVNVGEDGFALPSTLRRSTDGGRSWTLVHPPQLRSTVTNMIEITPDGRLLVNVYPSDVEGSLESGLYESTDTNWNRFERVAGPTPHDPHYFAGYQSAAVTDTQNRQWLFALGPKAFVSRDEGRTWEPTAIR